jgi:hypothetical protein
VAGEPLLLSKGPVYAFAVVDTVTATMHSNLVEGPARAKATIGVPDHRRGADLEA